MKIPIPILAAGAFATALPAWAQDRVPEQPVLTLEQTVALAGGSQPRLLAFESEARAAEQEAVAARSLPDLEVSAGIENFPIRGENAFNPIEDEMTMFTIGVMREQLRRSKREAEASRILADALVSRRRAGAEERRIRRNVMRAWIDAVEARAKQKLLETLIADLRTGRKVAEAGLSTGGSTASTALEADGDIALREAELAQARGAEARARSELARWIGEAAQRPLPNQLPRINLPIGFGEQPTRLGAHPEIQVAVAEQTAAGRGVEVARQERKWDITWSVSLGVRPKYGEMVSGSVSIPLQANRRNRQDRLLAAAQERAGAAALRQVDTARELEREYRGAVADYRAAEAEAERIDTKAVPALESAFAAAEARFAGGGGSLDQPFAIIRRYADAGIQSIEARARRERAAAEIIYFIGEADR